MTSVGTAAKEFTIGVCGCGEALDNGARAQWLDFFFLTCSWDQDEIRGGEWT